MLNAPDEIVREILALESARQTLSIRDEARANFMVFVKHVYDGFIEGSHHGKVAELFERLATDRGSRIIVNRRRTRRNWRSGLAARFVI